MITPVVGRAGTREHCRQMAARVAALLRPLSDAEVPIPRADWTVGEAAAHLAMAKGLMARVAAGDSLRHGDGTREGLAQANAERLAADPNRNGPALADVIEDETDAFCRNAEAKGAGEVIEGPLGPMPVEVFEAYVLTHLMQHGEGIARALKQATILERESVLAATPFIFFALEYFPDDEVIRDLRATYGLHLRGGPTVYVAYDEGKCNVTESPPGRVDCHISADPVAMFRVGIRLVGQWGPIARLKLLTWGPKPWLAFKFAGTFRPP